jgi:hypothetical protein
MLDECCEMTGEVQLIKQCFTGSKINLHKTVAVANCSEADQSTLFSPTFQCFGNFTGRCII